MALLWRGIGGAERVGRGRGRGRVWAKRSGSLVNLLIQPAGQTLADELADDFFLDAPQGGISANLNSTESADTLSSTAIVGSSGINANLTATESADTLSSTASLAIQASLGLTEGADTLSSSAALAITASANLTEGVDTAAGQAVLPIQAVGSTTEAPDTLSSTAILAITASLTQGEQPDTILSTATVGSTTITANLVVIEQADTVISTASTSNASSIDNTGFIDGLGRKKSKRQQDQDHLKEIIEAAFERIVAPNEEPTQTDKKQVVQSVRSEIKLDGIAATLGEIQRLVNEYAAVLKKLADDDEEEEILAFMMMG